MYNILKDQTGKMNQVSFFFVFFCFVMTVPKNMSVSFRKPSETEYPVPSKPNF